MEELIDILDKDGLPLGQAFPKSEVHAKGYYHNTAHIWFYTEDGKILLQQRSLNKLICPGLWDVSVAGHVDAGESVKQAAVRETWEEIGLEIEESELTEVGVFDCFQSYESGIRDNEFHNTFIARLSTNLEDLKFSKEEVENLKLVTLNDFEDLLNESDINNHFVSTNKPYYLNVLEAIRSELCLAKK